MITRIEATKYRCFERLGIDLGPYGVVVGGNGAGKTTLLDVPVLLGDMLKARDVNLAFLEGIPPRGLRASSLGELIYQGRGDWFILAVEARLPERVVRDLLEGATEAVRKNEDRWPRLVRYEVRLQVFNQLILQIQNEYLFTFAEQDAPSRSDQEGGPRLHGEVGPRRGWHFACRREYGGEVEFRPEGKPKARSQRATLEPTLLGLPRLLFEARKDYPAGRWLLDLLTEDVVFFDPLWSQLRTASPPGLPPRISADGRNLPWLALRLKNEAPEQFKAWEEHVRIALPQATAVDVFEREDDHHAYFRVTYNDAYQVTSTGLSEGTLRILGLTLLSYLENPPALLVAEEPENGIHPRAIEAVLDGLSSMYDSQVLLSSHSPVVVANVALEHLLAARLERGGAVTIVPGEEHPRLVDWKGGLDLGRLFAAGVLG